MSRYIDREDLLKNLKQFAPEHLTPLIVMLIEKQPTADVVEVVRCKDCKYFNGKIDVPCERCGDIDEPCGGCHYTGGCTYDDGYCHHGERIKEEAKKSLDKQRKEDM